MDYGERELSAAVEAASIANRDATPHNNVDDATMIATSRARYLGYLRLASDAGSVTTTTLQRIP